MKRMRENTPVQRLILSGYPLNLRLALAGNKSNLVRACLSINLINKDNIYKFHIVLKYMKSYPNSASDMMNEI